LTGKKGGALLAKARPGQRNKISKRKTPCSHRGKNKGKKEVKSHVVSRKGKEGSSRPTLGGKGKKERQREEGSSIYCCASARAPGKSKKEGSWGKGFHDFLQHSLYNLAKVKKGDPHQLSLKGKEEKRTRLTLARHSLFHPPLRREEEGKTGKGYLCWPQ